MSEYVDVTSLEPFAKNYASSFPQSTFFSVDSSGTSLEGRSSRNFTNSRARLMHLLLRGEPQHELFTHSLLAENIVGLALQPALQNDFKAVLAPQSLEWNKGEKGVDILISDSDDYVYMGIEVKLRQNKHLLDRDGSGWSTTLKAPFIYLSLGNWSVNMRHGEDVQVKDWISQFTIPQLQKKAQIPCIDEFREYVIGRIEKSVLAYQKKVSEPDRFFYGIPTNPEDKELLKEKLEIMQNLFVDLQTT